MNLSARRQGNAFVISILEPRIDAAIAIQFKDAFQDRTRSVKGRIVLDLNAVEFVDSSGLGAIVACLKNLSPDQNLVLSGMHPAVTRVFSLTQMDRVFTIHSNVEHAISAASA